MKKVLSLILALAMVLPLCPAGVISFPAFAATTTSGTTGDCTWSLSGTTLTISGNGKMGDYTYSSPAPWGKSITKVVIGDRVTNVGDYAFYDCNGLTSVTIGNRVTSIGSHAFSFCDGLTSITIPNSVTSIDSSAFSSCDGLESITVASGNAVYHSAGNCIIKTESKTLIAGCKNSVIPSDGSVTTIGKRAFYYCDGLTSITIPNRVTSIDSHAFYYCDGLTSITIPNSVTSIGSHAFYGCDGLTSITIPNRVTSIGSYAFSYCDGLTSVTIGNSVTSIDSSAFYGCDGLESITVASGNAVYHSAGNCIIRTESKILIAGCKNSVIPSDGSVTTIGSFAFSFCDGLTSITIPNSVTSIGSYAFSHCDGLTSVTIGNSVTSIDSSAFSDCDGLESITVASGNAVYHSAGNCIIRTESKTLIAGCKNSVIPSDGSVTTIGDFAFYNCDSLTSITIPNSVTSIGERAFDDCDGLTNVWYEGSSCSSISIGSSNSSLTNATWHYNSCMKNTVDYTHTYDNACDTTCNECTATRTVSGHVYDSVYDEECNECGWYRGPYKIFYYLDGGANAVKNPEVYTEADTIELHDRRYYCLKRSNKTRLYF